MPILRLKLSDLATLSDSVEGLAGVPSDTTDAGGQPGLRISQDD